MCIFYGHKFWVDLVSTSDGRPAGIVTSDLNDSERPRPCFLDGDPEEIVSEEDLPFTRLKVSLDEGEDDMESVRTSELFLIYLYLFINSLGI